MVTPAPPKQRTKSSTVNARRIRKHDRSGLVSGLIIVCPDCGDSFSIVPCLDSALAQSRGAWLLELFVWDHIQESKHRRSIRLPSAEELNRVLLRSVPSVAEPIQPPNLEGICATMRK